MADLKLRVAEAVQDDVNKGIVRIDSTLMKQIGVAPGDIVDIDGKRKTVAIADRSYPGDLGLQIIRMDGITRRNAKASIGEVVTVIKADVKEAKKVTIAPARKGIIVKASPQLFKQGLLGRVVLKGDIVSLGGTRSRKTAMSNNPFFEDMFNVLDENLMGFGFSDLKFIVAQTTPTKTSVIITEETEVTFNPEAVEVRDEATLEVNYEDIGGLSEEIKKIRELVELPLKHPEIFERLGIEAPKGVLLHGPPGTGKTLLAKAVASETNSTFLLINGPEIMCVDGDTEILTNPKGCVKAKNMFDGAHGKKEIREGLEIIELKEPISTFAYKDDKIEKAYITHVTKLKAPSYRVALSDGNSIITSSNQPFLVYRNGLEWKRLQDLREGEFVAKVKNIEILGESYRITFKIKGMVKKNGRYAMKSRNLSRTTFVKLPEKTSSELMEILGLVMSDGHVDKRLESITFANNDEKLRERFKKLVELVFGVACSEYADGRVTLYSKILAELFVYLGVDAGKKESRIPVYMYKLPADEIQAFVRGYFDGDGCCAMTQFTTKDGRKGSYPTPLIYSVQRSFLQQLQSLMQLRLGISTKILLHKTPKGDMHKLVVKGYEGRKKFLSIGSSCSKLEKLEKIIENIKIKEFESTPTPHHLVQSIRKSLAYKSFRNNDYYIYGKGVFTRYSHNKLFSLAQTHGIVNAEMQKEFDTLARDDIGWLRIKKIEDAGERVLYDFTVDKDSFVTQNLLLLHNSKYYGQSEENLRKKFEDAQKNAPSIIFIDEIDAIASKREETRGEVERRVVAQLLSLMDGLQNRGKVIVLGATNRPNSLDPALRRPGRFDRELEIGVPSKLGRLDILKIHTRNMPLYCTEIYPDLLEKNVFVMLQEREELSKKEIVEAQTQLDDLKEKQKKADESLLLKIVSRIKGLEADVKRTELTLQKLSSVRAVIDKEKRLFSSLMKKIKKVYEAKDTFQHDDPRQTIINNFSDKEQKAVVEKLVEAGILTKELRDRCHQEGVVRDLDKIASITHGFVGADLSSLAKEAAMVVLRRVLPDLKLDKDEPISKEVLEELKIALEDFREALKIVRPSAMREVLVEIPNVRWEDVGGLESVKRELREAVEWPLKNPTAFTRLGIRPPRGILMYGPPGTGKTLLAKAVAKESESNFILVNGPTLLSKWVGESEKAVREVFRKARQTSPTIIFFDEIDSIAPKRGASSDNHVTERVVNQILTEMDGLQELLDVVVIAATNRPDILDTALLRPGRFDRIILVPVPDMKIREEIFAVHLKNMPVQLEDNDDPGKQKTDVTKSRMASDEAIKETDFVENVNEIEVRTKEDLTKYLAKKTKGYVGADIESVCREAGMMALRENPEAKRVAKKHFDEALEKVRPSVTEDIEKMYEELQDYFKQARAKEMEDSRPKYLG